MLLFFYFYCYYYNNNNSILIVISCFNVIILHDYCVVNIINGEDTTTLIACNNFFLTKLVYTYSTRITLEYTMHVLSIFIRCIISYPIEVSDGMGNKEIMSYYVMRNCSSELNNLTNPRIHGIGGHIFVWLW